MTLYWGLCFLLFVILIIVDYHTYDQFEPSDLIMNVIFAFVPIINIYISLKMVYLFWIYLVDKFWD